MSEYDALNSSLEPAMENSKRDRDSISEEHDDTDDEMQDINKDIDRMCRGEPLTRKEMWAWYIYGVATEPFNTSIIGLYMSTALSLMAAMEGYELDHVTPCDYNATNYTCDYKWAGRWMDTTSFPLYMTTIASLIQAVLYIALGTLADHSSNRKRMLLAFAGLGGAACICLLGVTKSSLINTAAALYILASIGYGCSLVFYYAYIPLLARAHPRTIYRRLISLHGAMAVPLRLTKTKLLRSKKAERDAQYPAHVVEEFVTNKLSALGNLWMNLAAIIVLGIGIGTLSVMKDNQLYAMMIGSAIVGIWWWVFTIYPMFQLKERPGPPLSPEQNQWLFPLYSFKQTCQDVWRLPETLKFLVGWFLLADSMNTVNTVTSLFAQTVINMDEDLMAIGILIAPITSMIGAFGFSLLQERFNYRTRTLILAVVAMCVLLGSYVMIGFGTTAWGFSHSAEFYPLVAYFGLVNGATIALTRAQFVELCPPGMEAEFFSLFRITDKGSAFIGPLVAAGINSASHNLRFAYVWCLLLFLLSGVFFYWCDTKKGREDALEMGKLSGVTSDDLAEMPKAFL